jgi:hypothetical protein
MSGVVLGPWPGTRAPPSTAVAERQASQGGSIRRYWMDFLDLLALASFPVLHPLKEQKGNMSLVKAKVLLLVD